MAYLLIVEDEEPLRRALCRTLERGGHSVLEAADAEQARAILGAHSVDLMLCDINMPGESGLELVRSVRSQSPLIAVIMITAVDDPEVAKEALELGAYGYVIKPTRSNELLINVASGLRRHELELARLEQIRELEAKLVTRGAALRDLVSQLEQTQANVHQAEQDAVNRLVTALTLRSEETGGHIQRMGGYAAALAKRRGVEAWTDNEIRLAAMLHDVGKIGIPDAILLKPGSLTEDEFDIIRRHSDLGHSLLRDGRSKVVLLGARIALTHHERWDGSGYPSGLAGEQIPIEGRIAAVADVFDALTSDRVYRSALPFDQAADAMRAERGAHFDPDLIDIFVESLDELETIRVGHPDPEPGRDTMVLPDIRHG